MIDTFTSVLGNAAANPEARVSELLQELADREGSELRSKSVAALGSIRRRRVE